MPTLRILRITPVVLMVGGFVACATSSTAPATEKQSKVRRDLDQCNAAAAGKAHSIAVTPEGKYSFQVTGISNADTILACMSGKGYSAVRLDNPMDHGGKEMIRSGGEGQELRK
jgi:hypothetical protein